MEQLEWIHNHLNKGYRILVRTADEDKDSKWFVHLYRLDIYADCVNVYKKSGYDLDDLLSEVIERMYELGIVKEK